MKDEFPRGAASIAGLATYGVGEMPGFSSLDLAATAGLMALQDADARIQDVDALFGCLPDDLFGTLSMAEYYGISPRFTDNNRTGGSSFISHMITASIMIDAGYIDNALITYGSNQRSSGGKLATPAKSNKWEARYDPIFPLSSYALVAARHMHEFGTRREDLAAVAVAARQWANTNPEAFAKGPLSIEDCLESRMISSPLTKADCCLVTDGAAAIYLTSTRRASDLPKPPVPILGAAAATWHNSISAMPDLTATAARESGARAMAIAGVTPQQMDTVQLYDAFTINTLIFLEDLGFCVRHRRSRSSASWGSSQSAAGRRSVPGAREWWNILKPSHRDSRFAFDDLRTAVRGGRELDCTSPRTAFSQADFRYER